jgi:hypothetical protein
MSVTLAELCDAIANTIKVSCVPAALTKVQSYDELTEGYGDLPMAQVYPESGETDAFTSNDRTTFGASSRVTDVVIIVDVPCRKRNMPDEDMKAVVDTMEVVQTVLEAQRKKPYFGNSSVKGFKWRWERVTFRLGNADSTNLYPGLKFRVTLKVF